MWAAVAVLTAFALVYQPGAEEVRYIPPAPAVGLVGPLATYSVSGVASIDITSVLSAEYDSYLVNFSGRPATTDQELWLRTDEQNGASFDVAGYQFANDQISLAGAQNYSSNSAVSIVAVGDNTAGLGVGSPSGAGVAVEIRINEMGSAVRNAAIHIDGGYLTNTIAHIQSRSHGVAPNTARINALQILFETGNIAEGTAEVYGYRK